MGTEFLSTRPCCTSYIYILPVLGLVLVLPELLLRLPCRYGATLCRAPVPIALSGRGSAELELGESV